MNKKILVAALLSAAFGAAQAQTTVVEPSPARFLVGMGMGLSGSGVASGLDVKFDDATSAVVEAEYFSSPNVGFKLRYVNEKYKSRGFEDVDGSHVGISVNYYF